MTDLAPTTPVIVGIGFRQDRSDDPTQTPEAYQLMVEAARIAADDAGSRELLAGIESISVPQGLWAYPNPGRLIGEALGCPSARSIVAGLGVLQLTTIDDLCRAIAAGEHSEKLWMLTEISTCPGAIAPSSSCSGTTRTEEDSRPATPRKAR